MGTCNTKESERFRCITYDVYLKLSEMEHGKITGDYKTIKAQLILPVIINIDTNIDDILTTIILSNIEVTQKL